MSESTRFPSSPAPEGAPPRGAVPAARWVASLQGPGLRLAGLGLLLLVLLIPSGMIESRIGERGERRDQAALEVGRAWGPSQTVAGPLLRLPYRIQWQEGERTHHRNGWLVLAPRRLEVEGHLQTQVRRRGIFELPVYVADLTLSGDFEWPEASALPVPASAVDWSRAEWVLGLSQPAALAADSRIELDGDVLSLEPSALHLGPQGVHVRLPGGAPGLAQNRRLPFVASLRLRGSQALNVVPAGNETRLRLRSDWPHPAFGGAGLPLQHHIDASGFDAQWSVAHLGRGFASIWRDDEVSRAQLDAAALGVMLKVPVDPYRMAERIAKYGALVLLLSFGTLWILELIGGRPLHPVQYLLFGASLCLFGLLQLALAEHFGFAVAFVLAALAVVIQAGVYAGLASGSRGRGLTVAGVLAGWFAYLYAVLQAEDAAFLMGAVALFAALCVAMWATRGFSRSPRQDWDVADATLE